MVLTELGETCKERGWIPISSLAECKASTVYFHTHFPSYVFHETEFDYSIYPKGCIVFTNNDEPRGFFNTHDSGASDSDARALCTISRGNLKNYKTVRWKSIIVFKCKGTF